MAVKDRNIITNHAIIEVAAPLFTGKKGAKRRNGSVLRQNKAEVDSPGE